MKRIAVALIFALVLVPALLANGSTVRGKFYRVDPYGRAYPAAGIQVRVIHPRYGATPMYASGSDGMYYIPGLEPGPQTLEVWVTKEPRRYAIVVQPREFTDLPALRVD